MYKIAVLLITLAVVLWDAVKSPKPLTLNDLRAYLLTLLVFGVPALIIL